MNHLPILLLLLVPLATALSDSDAATIADLQLASFSAPKPAIPIPPTLPPTLRDAFLSLSSLKSAIFSDPNNFTSNWSGPDVCSYNGVFCSQTIVTGLDLTGANIAAFLPSDLSLLSTASLFHANSNRFCGIVPSSFADLINLSEFDISNNRLSGPFPSTLLSIPSLTYLDLRFNHFSGPLPPQLFDANLDAIFLNDNRFDDALPDNIGNSPASIAVLANNNLTGSIPQSIGRMPNLEEFVISNNGLVGCLPFRLGNLTVFDVGFNRISGSLPESLSGLDDIEELDVSNNLLTGVVWKEICELRGLSGFRFDGNYFNEIGEGCERFDDENNCVLGRKKQRNGRVCAVATSRPVDCRKFDAGI